MTETDLRWRLRQLPRDIEPECDLWQGIAARIEARPARRPSRRGWMSLAMAASVVLALGLGWQLRPASVAAPQADPTGRLVAREAKAMTLEYEAALRQFQGAPVPDALAGSLHTLDQSAAQIRAAIHADPESVYLLQQLRKTYSRRLTLTQRAVLG